MRWDCQPDPKTPYPFLTFVFTLVMFVSFGIFLLLLPLRGFNWGYFPRSLFDAIFSMGFAASLGAFFGFFVYFRKYVTFEEICIYLLVPVPVLGIRLPRALIERANVEALNSGPKEVQ
jgi:hypothetical protein